MIHFSEFFRIIKKHSVSKIDNGINKFNNFLITSLDNIFCKNEI